MIGRYPYNTIMNSPRFYCPVPLAIGVTVDLPENAARHACRVLRLRAGDSLILFDGRGGEYVSCINRVERERVAVDLLEWRDAECESPIEMTLIQALQSGEKMDLTIQKAVELGVAKVLPVVSRRSVVRLEGERAARREAHWRGVVVAACEQCGRNRVPEVAALEGLERWLAKPPTDLQVVRLMLAPGSALTLNALPRPLPGTRIELLIGAEGGLAPEEMALAQQAGFIAVRLGPRILRTETAGLAALAAMQCLWGDFGQEVGHV